jgi:mannose-6-phosphate isomerase-like protein (cupin superfamily)
VKRDSILMEFSGGGQVTGKVWGFTQACLITPLVELHRIVVRPHMHCSLHLHERAWNAFVVTAGVLHIDVHKADYNLVDTTTLGPGGVTTVAPGEKHQFRTGPEGAEAYELYYLEPLGPDIKRDCEGGANE